MDPITLGLFTSLAYDLFKKGFLSLKPGDNRFLTESINKLLEQFPEIKREHLVELFSLSEVESQVNEYRKSAREPDLPILNSSFEKICKKHQISTEPSTVLKQLFQNIENELALDPKMSQLVNLVYHRRHGAKLEEIISLLENLATVKSQDDKTVKYDEKLNQLIVAVAEIKQTIDSTHLSLNENKTQLISKLDAEDDFEFMLSKFAYVDQTLLTLMPSMMGAKEVHEREDIFDKVLQQVIPELSNFVKWLNSKITITNLAKVSQEIEMKILVSKNIDRITFSTKNTELSINDPILLWECNHGIPDQYSTGYPCPFHIRSNFEEVEEKFGLLNEIHYGLVKTFWKDHRTLWPPSIDSLFMAKVIENEYGKKTEIEKILDLGCGTGFLGICLAKTNELINEIHFSDIFIEPLVVAKFNWALNFSEGKQIAKFFHSNHYRRLPNTRYDLVICNPPYLPFLNPTDVIDMAAFHPVVGTYLLENAIELGSKFTKELVLGCSSFALQELKKSIAKTSAKYRLISSRETPFRVTHAFHFPKYMNALMKLAESEDPNRKIRIKNDNAFKLWYDFNIYKIQYN